MKLFFNTKYKAFIMLDFDNNLEITATCYSIEIDESLEQSTLHDRASRYYEQGYEEISADEFYQTYRIAFDKMKNIKI